MKKINKKSKARFEKALYKNSYPAYALVMILVIIVFFEGAMFGVAGAQDIKSGLAIMDMSQSFLRTQKDLASLAQPLVDTVASVNTFYEMSAHEVINLLQNNIVEGTISAVQDVQEFYRAASNQLAAVLDFSSPSTVYAAH